ncbi:MAG: Flp pilus assembly protein RcpC/CpaB [Abditibacteriota bacterium]|nr:Flp pilus assembly protein RcpC/CpaB [Abditibacteriota bacterium]
MRPNRKIRIGAAILAFGLLLWGLYSLMSRFRGTVEPQPNSADTSATNAVPVADAGGDRVVFLRADDNPADDVRFIPARTILTADMVEIRRADVGDTDSFVTDIENGAAGFITRRALPFGSQLSKADLVGHISEVGVAGALLPGSRAMVVPIVNKSTLHDLVRVGDRVDIVASFDQLESRTVVQDVRVLAVDVFGKDYPQVKVAMRGDYKAPARNVSTANPSSPPNAGAPDAEGAAPGAAPAAAPAANGAPAPTPTAGPPPAKPDPALTIEVTPEQATAISLTQASGQNIDFLIRPRSEPRIAPSGAAGTAGALTAGGATTDVTSVRVASTTRNRLAPYATRAKQGNTTTTARTTRSATTESFNTREVSRSRDRSDFPVPPYPTAPLGGGNMTVPPAPIPAARTVEAPETYDIPVYGDGKLMRTDTVKKPRD